MERTRLYARRLLAVLSEGYAVHILEELIFLDKLVLEHLQLGVDLSILILQAVDFNLSVHVLLVEVFPRLECHLRNLVLHLPRDLIRRANLLHLTRGKCLAWDRHAKSVS